MITHKTCAVSKTGTVRLISPLKPAIPAYSGLNLNQDKATKPQTVQIVRQGEVTP
ncbi:hypothetical protein IRM60_09890, partial [Neisseria meningitidis]|nr:hypothetical protein [Neisseria meningitidis]